MESIRRILEHAFRVNLERPALPRRAPSIHLPHDRFSVGGSAFYDARREAPVHDVPPALETVAVRSAEVALVLLFAGFVLSFMIAPFASEQLGGTPLFGAGIAMIVVALAAALPLIPLNIMVWLARRPKHHPGDDHEQLQ
jgi:hypothetical protein